MIIKRASADDLKEILDLQKLAYVSEAEIYKDYSIPPLTQTLEQIQADFDKQLFLKAFLSMEESWGPSGLTWKGTPAILGG